MCGIIYYENGQAKFVSKPVTKRYYKQKSRGSDGFGFVAVSLDTRSIKGIRRRANEKEILDDLQKVEANAILFHHRFPTSTPNLKEACHPITVKNEKLDHVYYVVHNGIIGNDDDLKVAHEKQGYKYTTKIERTTSYITSGKTYTEKSSVYNDSEALAIELAMMIDGKKEYCSASGSIAFIVIQANKKGKAIALYYGRNTQNPLTIERSGGIFSIRSEGGQEQVAPHKLFRYDLKTKETTAVDRMFPTSPEYGYYGTTYGADRRTSQGRLGFGLGEEDEQDELDEAMKADGYGLVKSLDTYLEKDNCSMYDVETMLAFGNSIKQVEIMIAKELREVEAIRDDAEGAQCIEAYEEADDIIADLLDKQNELLLMRGSGLDVDADMPEMPESGQAKGLPMNLLPVHPNYSDPSDPSEPKETRFDLRGLRGGRNGKMHKRVAM